MTLAITRNRGCSTEHTQVLRADTALNVPHRTHKRNTQEKGERPLLQRRHSKSLCHLSWQHARHNMAPNGTQSEPGKCPREGVYAKPQPYTPPPDKKTAQRHPKGTPGDAKKNEKTCQNRLSDLADRLSCDSIEHSLTLFSS